MVQLIGEQARHLVEFVQQEALPPSERVIEVLAEVAGGPPTRVRRLPIQGFGLLGCVALLDLEGGADTRLVAVKTHPQDRGVWSALRSLQIPSREVHFFRDHRIDAVPDCLAAYLSEADGEYCLVLEGVENATSYDQVGGLSEKQTVSLLRALARLHADLQSSGCSDLGGWGSAAYVDLVRLYDSGVTGFLTEFGTEMSGGVRKLVESPGADIAAAVHEYIATENRRSHLCHFDLRSDNVLVRPDGEHVFIDWQFAANGVGGMDVAHLLATSVDVGSDDGLLSLLEAYASECRRRGMSLTSDQVRDDFRMGLLTRLVLCLAAVMHFPHPTERSRAARRTAVSRLLRLLEAAGVTSL